MKRNLYNSLIKLLIEKGGVKKKNSNNIKFYAKELLVKNKDTKANYEIRNINSDDPNNLIFSIERYDVDGQRKEIFDVTQEEMIKNYEPV